MKQQTRPTSIYRRGILFDPDRTQPDLVWVECKRFGNDFEHTQPGPFIGYDTTPASILFKRNQRRAEDLSNTIEVSYRDEFMSDDSKPNLSLIKAIGIEKAYLPGWRGPILLVQRKGVDPDSPYCGDITLEDFSHALDILDDSEDVRTIEDGFPRDDSVLGVKVSCTASKKLLDTPSFLSVDVTDLSPLNEFRHNSGEISPLSKMLGLPIRVLKNDPSYWSTAQVFDLETLGYLESPEKNDYSAWLFIETDLAKSNWGRAQSEWILPAGDLLLVNAKGGDLSLNDAEALCRFCREKLQPMFEDALGFGRVQRTAQEVLDFINPENLRRFREETLWREEDL